MHVAVLTLFPELFEPFLSTSLVGRAIDEGLLRVEVEDLREHTEDRHRSVDDEPYGGGGGMVLTAQPLLSAIEALSGGFRKSPPRRILLSPQGRRLDEALVRELAECSGMLLVCGRYEGVDERVVEAAIDEEISIGDFVLSGGELPAMVLIEAISRQVPGVVGLGSSVERDSFREGLLDFPHYTRPREIAGRAVPEILLSGNHARIEAWRNKKSLEATLRKRPDLLRSAGLEAPDLDILAELAEELDLELPAGLQGSG
ncbi:MAG: tRNA (guanosine(37)-N1)-methyltransferase TrmD [Acidobacteriota bacterium]